MPVRFVSIMRCQSASSISSVGLFLVIPATASRMSTLPNASRHSSRSRSSDAISDTSAAIDSVRRPRFSILGGHVLDELDAAAGRDHVGARVSQPQRQRAADSARTTNDDGRPAGEIEKLHEYGQTDDGRCGAPRAAACGRSGVTVAIGRRLLRLVPARLEQVIVHRPPGGLGVAGADRLVNPPVHLGRVAEIALARAGGRLAPAFVVERRDHLDERCHDRVARGGGDAAMEIDVMDQEHARLLHRGKQARDFFGEGRDLLGGGALGGEPGRADLQDPSRLVHLFAGEPVKRREEAQRIGIERRRSLRDIRTRTVARSDDAHRGESAQPGANRRPADANLGGEIAFGRQAIAGLERAALDEVANMRDDLAGATLPPGAGRQPA